MNTTAPAKGLLKVTGILLIIFGAIATVVSLIAVIGSAALTSVAGAYGAAAIGGLLLLVTIFSLINSVLSFVFGIMGAGKRSADPSKAGFYVVAGIILAALALISLIMGIASSGFSFTSLIGFVLPVLYIIGGLQNKKAVVTEQSMPN